MRILCKYIAVAVGVLLLASCIENDIPYPKIKGDITTFEVEGQVGVSVINSDAMTVSLEIADNVDISAVRITKFEVNNDAKVSPEITSVVDLSDTLRYTLTTYQDYEWRIAARYAAQEESQLVNGSFDEWYQSGKTWYPCADLSAENYFWDTGNKGGSIVGINPTTPEESVVVKGKAVKMQSMSLLGIFVAGSVYYGKYNKTIGLGAEILMGRPFTSKPRALKGYYNYTPGIINIAKAPFESLKGKTDSCHLYVLLTDWPAPFAVNTSTKTFMSFSDSGIIGIGELKTDKATAGYQEFEINIEYRRKFARPTYIIIVATASKYGDYFSGSTKSLLYIDELTLEY